MTTVAIHQPNYLPWLGYFRKLMYSDFFVFFDNVQMPGGKSYMYRTAINMQGRQHWLSVPVSNKSKFLPICETSIADNQWIKKHIRTLNLNYSYSPWKSLINERISPVLENQHSMLSSLNIDLITVLLDILDIKDTTLIRASDMELERNGADSIKEILLKLKADSYITGKGKGTSRYLNKNEMHEIGVGVHFVSDNFPEYDQHRNEFIPGLSIIDVILNCGPEETRNILLKDF
jgi:hypothetical protein